MIHCKLLTVLSKMTLKLTLKYKNNMYNFID